MRNLIKNLIFITLLISFTELYSQANIKVIMFETNCKEIFPSFIDRYENILFFMCGEKLLIEFNLTHFNYYKRVLDFNIDKIYYGDDGNIYAYQRDKGKYKTYLYSNGKFIYQKDVNSIPYNKKDSRGNLWKLENNKVYKYVNNKFIEYITDKNRIYDEIFAFDVDKYGNIWIETENYYAKYDGNKWNKIDIIEEHGLIYEGWAVDSKGNFWIRANGSNILFKFDGNYWYEDILDVVEEEFYENYLKKPYDDKLKEIIFIDVDKNDNLIFFIRYNNNLYIASYNENGINK